jgi:hypothetical protein
VGGEGNAPGKKHPKKPRMGRIPDQIDSGKRDNDNEKDGRWMTKPRSGGSLNFSCCELSAFVSPLDDL